MQKPLAVLAPLFASLVFACASTEHVTIPAPGSGQSTDGTDPTAADAATFCADVCDREQQCNTSLDAQTCVNGCQNADAAVFPRLRQDVVSLVLGCVDATDCKTVLAGDVVSSCADDAVARVAPSDAAVSYCDAFVAAESKCGSTVSHATCLDAAKLYTDDAIGQAENCTSRACSDIAACVTAAFGTFGDGAASSTGDGGGSGTCSGSFSLGTCESCAEQSCCAQASACAKDAQCMPIVRACQGTGGSSAACAQAFEGAPSTTSQLADAYFACATTSCSTTCRLGGT